MTTVLICYLMNYLAGGDLPLAGGSVLFDPGETITMSGVYTGTATIVNIHGLQGFRDITLFRYMKILKPPVYMVGDKYSIPSESW